MRKKALLMILDGWGFGDKTKSDVISSTPTPYWDIIEKLSLFPTTGFWRKCWLARRSNG